MIKRLHIFVILLFTSSVSLVAQSNTMTVNANGVQIGFSQDRTKIQATDVASNVVFIINNTNKTLDLDLQVNAPAGWRLFGKASNKITINSKDTVYIPLRVRPSYDIKGNTNYIVNVFLSNEAFTITSAIWYIVVDKVSSWHAYTPVNKLYFTTERDSVNFNISIVNQGNSDEALRVEMLPEKDIILIDAKGEAVLNVPTSIYLPSGRDTTLSYNVKLATSVVLPSSDASLASNIQSKYRIKIRVLNEKSGVNNNKTWAGSIDLFKIESEVKIKETKYNALPLTLELNAFDALSEHTYSNLSIYGNKRFENNSMLNYYFQADFVQNQLNSNSYLGNYQYVGYFHKNFSVEAGDIGANRSGSTLSGKGAKASVSLYNNTLGALYIRKPKLFEDYYASGYGFFHNLNLKGIRWDNYYQHLDNDLNQVISDFGNTYLNFRLGRSHSLRLGGGYSSEQHDWDPNNPVTLIGYGAEFGYNGNFRKLGVSLNANYSNPKYTPRRGSTVISPLLRYKFNPKYSIELAYSYRSFEPEMYSRGLLVSDEIFNIQNSYSFKLFYNNGSNLFIFQPTYFSVESNTLETNTGGLTIDYRLKSKTAFKFYSSVFMGYTSFPTQTNLGDIFISNIRASLRYNRFQGNIRYYYGPNYQLEQLQYTENAENPQKLFANVYYDYWFLNNKMRLNLNLNYTFNTIKLRQQLNTRPELFYYAKNGFRFSIYARYVMYGEGEYVRSYPGTGGGLTEEVVAASMVSRFEFGAGVKFNVNMPIGFQKNYDVKVVAFRDMNGNGIMDLNEKGIRDMLIHIKLNDTVANNSFANSDGIFSTPEEFDLVTNIEGEVLYSNIPLGDYVITAFPLSSMGGWFDGKTFYRTIDKNKTIYIPLSRGARISGGILLERDRYGSNKSLNLSNIRVTAINQDDGKTFSTLTTGDGNFVMFVPNGNYLIMINESAVDNHFSFVQNNIPIEINKDFENYNVSFYLAEKQRNVNVKGGSTRPLPINRKIGASNTRPSLKSNSNDSSAIAPQYTQLEDPQYLPVVEPTEEGAVWVIKIFPNEEPRRFVTDFDTLNGLAQVRCVTGQGAGFVYITQSFAKKSVAKKTLKNVQKRGFEQAQVINMVFGNSIEKEDSIPVLKAIDQQIQRIESEEDRVFFRVEIKASAKQLTPADFGSIVPEVATIYEVEQDGLYKYAVGQFDTFEEAKTYKMELVQRFNLNDSFVTQYKKAW